VKGMASPLLPTPFPAYLPLCSSLRLCVRPEFGEMSMAPKREAPSVVANEGRPDVTC